MLTAFFATAKPTSAHLVSELPVTVSATEKLDPHTRLSKIPASPPGKAKRNSPSKTAIGDKGKSSKPKGGSQFMENFLSKRPAESVIAEDHVQAIEINGHKKHATDAAITPL